MTNDVRAPRDFADTQMLDQHCAHATMSSVFGPSFGAPPPPRRVVAQRRAASTPVAPPAVHQGYPDPEKLLREREQRTRDERRAEREHHERIFGSTKRQAEGMKQAWNDGREVGHRHGFVEGTHWGILCGAIGGVPVGAIAVVLFIKLGMWWPL